MMDFNSAMSGLMVFGVGAGVWLAGGLDGGVGVMVF